MINDSTWNAIISLLSPDYPDLTREKLEAALNSDIREYVTTREACQILHYTPQTLWRLAKEGKIRTMKPSYKKVLYNLADIRKILDSADRKDD